MAYYVFDDDKNKVEAYSKEEFLAFLEQIIEDQSLAGIDEHTAFVTKIKGSVDGESHEISFVTQTQYNTLKANNQLVIGAYYFITDDTTAEDLEAAITNIINRLDACEDTLSEHTSKLSKLDQNDIRVVDNQAYISYPGLYSLSFLKINSSERITATISIDDLQVLRYAYLHVDEETVAKLQIGSLTTFISDATLVSCRLLIKY